MAVLSITALYVLILVRVSLGYLRRRDPLLRDVVLIFASVAMLFVLSVLRMAIGEPPRLVTGLFVALLLGQPFFTLRLVSKLRRVPLWAMWAALAGWLATAAPIVVAAGGLPRFAVWSVVGVFVVVEGAAAWLLGREARRRGGTARIRLGCAAAGTALFGASLVVAGAGLPVASRCVAVVSTLMYVLAFLPPWWLRRVWSWGAAYSLMRRLLVAPVDEPAQQTWRRYCQGAREVVGADDVVVLLPAEPGTVQAVAQTGLPVAGQRYADGDVEQLLAATTTVDARRHRPRAPRVAVELARAAEARFVTAAPLDVSGRRGALVLLNRYRTLFADDDVALSAELGAQAAAVAERAAVHSEQRRLAQIVESSHDAIIGTSIDGVITSWNAGAERIYGHRATEAVGQPAGILVAPGQDEVEAELLRRLVRGERIEQYHLQRRRRDGTTITVSLTLSSIRDTSGRFVGVASISRDISERQRAEAMFRGLLEAAPDAIVGVTRDGRIALINAQAERLFGYRRHELLGQSIELLVPERFRTEHSGQRERYFGVSKGRHMGAGIALAAVRKDGSEFPAEISLSALETDQGTIVSAAVRDVTERLEAQAERERLAAQTERDAAERRMQHARRLESLGQLAGGVAHDFNNILAVIANYAELLTDTLDAPAPSEADLAAARADLGQISRAAERATRLTKQLLAFGRREITQAEVLNLNEVIGDVEQMLRRVLGEHIHLVASLDPELWPVFADPSQVEQILVNLAVNARDAMPTGGTLSIDTTNADLEHDDVAGSTIQPGRYVRVRVSDTGGGMPPEVAERAFEPFYTTKPQGAGTGLGLATVYGIATAAGGDIRLYSEAGIGTTVTIVLPATEVGGGPETAARPARPDAVPAGSPAGETILLVEDEDALRDTTTRILTRAGYRVVAAAGGEQAIRTAQTHPDRIGLLLTDVIMPEMMGNEVAARVRAVLPDVPVLYMSGYAQPVLAEHGTLEPGVTMIEKPFSSRELLGRVAALLHQPADATRGPG
jgi:PAS domain S-box-containing protein